MAAADKLKLDNIPAYEAGSFTPDITGSGSGVPDYAYREGRYVRSSDKAFISIYVKGAWKSPPSGEFIIKGLPFIMSGMQSATGSSLILYNLTSDSLKIRLQNGENILYLMNESTGNNAQFGVECDTGMFEITVNMSYLIN